MKYSLKGWIVRGILRNRWKVGIALSAVMMFATEYVATFLIPIAMTLIVEIIMRNKVFIFKPNFKIEDFPKTREGIHTQVEIWWKWLVLDDITEIDICKIKNIRRGHVNILFECDSIYPDFTVTNELKIRDDFTPPLYEILQWRHDVYSKRTVEDNEV